MKKMAMQIRALLLAVFASPGVFALAAFTVSGMFMPGRLGEVRGLIEVNVLMPWGLALALLRLYRAKAQEKPARADVCVLFVLLAWLIVPFALRFGPTDANINTWKSFAVMFFGLYALLAEMDDAELGRQMDAAAALCALVSFVFAGALLYCAAVVESFRTPYSEFGFGVYQYAQLCAEQHYNATGMLAMCGTFMCLMGVMRRKHPAARVLHLIPAAMMALVVVLSQSRTARYSLLAGLAVGAYGAVASRLWHKKLLVRQLAGMLAGIAVLAGGYVLSAKLTDAALMHYARARAAEQTAQIADAADPPAAQAVQAEPIVFAVEPEAEQARGAGEGTFTGRTAVWKNIFSMWKANPKYFLIGNGVGRTSRDILIGTPLEYGGANMAHNAYIQFTMDQGLMGFALLCAFFALLLLPALRTLLAAPDAAVAGSLAMCMLAVGCLLTGMMENEPLSAMRPCNVMLFFALAVIAAVGKKAKR